LRRNATLILVLALLVGSVVAFLVAERLKLEKSPVAGTAVDKVFSPLCDCPQQRARIEFRLRRADRLTLSLLDTDGAEVRTLVDGDRYPKGPLTFFWNGRDDDGRLVPEGSYRPKVELGRADRTIVLPNPIRVDVTAPALRASQPRPSTISPDGDGRGDVTRVRYRANEPVQASLFVGEWRRVVSRRKRPAGVLQWLGGGPGGKALRPGTYRLTVQAQDLAGNRSPRVESGTVTIRFVVLGDRLIRARPGERVQVGVSADARRVFWVLRKGSSVVERGTARRRITFVAPTAPGRYTLTAYAAGHRSRALVVVRKAP
jgi:hypothetical protein